MNRENVKMAEEMALQLARSGKPMFTMGLALMDEGEFLLVANHARRIMLAKAMKELKPVVAK